MWSQMPHVGSELRPDKCGVMFDRAGNDVIVGRLEQGKKLNDLTYKQVQVFNQDGFSVLLFRGRDRKFFLADGHDENYVIGVVRDRAKLH